MSSTKLEKEDNAIGIMQHFINEHDTKLLEMRSDLVIVQDLSVEISNDVTLLQEKVKEQKKTIKKLERDILNNNNFTVLSLNEMLERIEKSDRRNKAADRRIAALEARFLVAGQPFTLFEKSDDGDGSDSDDDDS